MAKNYVIFTHGIELHVLATTVHKMPRSENNCRIVFFPQKDTPYLFINLPSDITTGIPVLIYCKWPKGQSSGLAMNPIKFYARKIYIENSFWCWIYIHSRLHADCKLNTCTLRSLWLESLLSYESTRKLSVGHDCELTQRLQTDVFPIRTQPTT